MKEYKIEIPGAISGDFRQDIFRCDHNEIADQLETSLRHRDVFAIPFNPETKRRGCSAVFVLGQRISSRTGFGLRMVILF
jgi:hypothetical protein